MPSICEICLIEGITEGTNVYEDGEKLRAHLIEVSDGRAIIIS
jgi:hypothetical protein